MMCLRFVFLLITGLAGWSRLSQREETWKTAGILMLRHQIAVMQRRQPRRPHLNWADRALIAALPSLIPKARRRGLRLLVTPRTIPGLAPRHRRLPPGRQVQAQQARPPCHPPECQGPGLPAGPGEPRMGLSQNLRRAGRPVRAGSRAGGVGDPEECRDRFRAAAHRGCLVAVPAF